MKNWNSAEIVEIKIADTAYGVFGIHSDGLAASRSESGCKNKEGNYRTIYGFHHAHAELVEVENS